MMAEFAGRVDELIFELIYPPFESSFTRSNVLESCYRFVPLDPLSLLQVIVSNGEKIYCIFKRVLFHFFLYNLIHHAYTSFSLHNL